MANIPHVKISLKRTIRLLNQPNRERKITLVTQDKIFQTLKSTPLNTNIGSAIADHDLHLINTKLSQIVYHVVGGQPLMMDEGLITSLVIDIRDSFFYGRHRGPLTDGVQNWRNNSVFWIKELMQFSSALQKGKCTITDINGVLNSATIENGTPYVGILRTISEVIAIQSHADGRLGGVERTLHNDLMTLATNFGQNLGNVQAVGEDEQLKQAIMLLLGGVLMYSEEAHAIAAQERHWGPLRVQDCIKYIATTDLTWGALRRVKIEAIEGHIKGRRLTAFTEGHIYELIMQSLWYFIGHAEKQRKRAFKIFLGSAGHVLPLPVDSTAFLTAFLYKFVSETTIYNLERISQTHGPYRAMILSPAKELMLLAESQRAIENLFPEGWEFGLFTASRATAGETKMDPYSHNALKAQKVGEKLTLGFGGLQAALTAGLSESGGTMIGLGINLFWTTYSLLLTTKAQHLKNEMENFEIFMGKETNWEGQIPPLCLSSIHPEELKGSSLKERTAELVTWHTQAQRALREMPEKIKEFSKQNKGTLKAVCEKLRYESAGSNAPSGKKEIPDDVEFLTSRFRQSVMEFMQATDIGIYHNALEEIHTGEKEMGFALLKFLRLQSHDYSSFYLASQQLEKMEGEEKAIDMSQVFEHLKDVYDMAKKARDAEDPTQRIRATVTAVRRQIKGQHSIDDLLKLFERPYHQYPVILKDLRGALEDLKKAVENRDLAKYARALLKKAPTNHPLRVILRTLLNQDASLATKMVEILKQEQKGLEEIPEIRDFKTDSKHIKDLEKLMHDIVCFSQENLLPEEDLKQLDEISQNLKKTLASLVHQIAQTVPDNEAWLNEEKPNEPILKIAKRTDVAFGGKDLQLMEKEHLKTLLQKCKDQTRPDDLAKQEDLKELKDLLTTVNRRESFLVSLIDEKYFKQESTHAGTFMEILGSGLNNLGLKLIGKPALFVGEWLSSTFGKPGYLLAVPLVVIGSIFEEDITPFDHQFEMEPCPEHIAETDTIYAVTRTARLSIAAQMSEILGKQIEELADKFRLAKGHAWVEQFKEFQKIHSQIQKLGQLELLGALDQALGESVEKVATYVAGNLVVEFDAAKAKIKASEQAPENEEVRKAADSAMKDLSDTVDVTTTLGYTDLLIKPRDKSAPEGLIGNYDDLKEIYKKLPEITQEKES